MSTAAFLAAIKARRSVYSLGKSSPIPDNEILDIVKEVVKHTPSSFNSQSSRVVVVFGEEHDKVWQFTKDAIKAIVPSEAWPKSEKRLSGFQNAYGTILIYEDRDDIRKLEETIPLYADKFGPWSGHSTGIVGFALWTALEGSGLGVNLQHYNPLIDAKVAEAFNIPESWELTSQLVFGAPEGAPPDKSFKDIESRVKSFGAQ